VRVLSRENSLYFRALSSFHALMAEYYYKAMNGTALPATFAMTAYDLMEAFKALLTTQLESEVAERSQTKTNKQTNR
jgi:hypothetical protein